MKLEKHEFKKTFQQGMSSAKRVEVIAFGEQDQGREAWGWGLLVVIVSFVVQFDILYSSIYYIDRNKM